MICNDLEVGLQIEPHRVVSHDIAVSQHEQLKLEQVSPQHPMNSEDHSLR